MFEKAVTLYTNAAEKSGHLKVSIADSIYAWADTRLDSEEYDRARIPVQTSIEHIQQAHRRQNELRHGTNMEPHGRSLYALGKAPSRAFL